MPINIQMARKKNTINGNPPHKPALNNYELVGRYPARQLPAFPTLYRNGARTADTNRGEIVNKSSNNSMKHPVRALAWSLLLSYLIAALIFPLPLIAQSTGPLLAQAESSEIPPAEEAATDSTESTEPAAETEPAASEERPPLEAPAETVEQAPPVESGATVEQAVEKTPAVDTGTQEGVPNQPAQMEKLLVLDFETQDVSQEQAAAVRDSVKDQIFRNGNFVLIGNQQTQIGLMARGLDASGCFEAECAAKLGDNLGASKVVIGRVAKVAEGQWTITGQLVDVASGKVERSEMVEYSGDIAELSTAPVFLLTDRLTGPGTLEDEVVDEVAEEKPAETPTAEEGLPTWIWIAAGVGGLLLLVLAGGGGDDGGGSGGSGGATGGAIISW